MSLTVASTTLSVDWAEFSTVNYTASTLGTISDMIDEVDTKLNRGTLSTTTTPSTTQVGKWLVRAKEALAQVKQFAWKRRYVKATLTADTFRYSLPPDYDGGPIKIRDTTNDSLVKMVSPHVFDTLYPDMAEETSGTILVACIKNTELWFSPPPDGADTVELEYQRSGDDITYTDVSWLPEIERFLCCDFACAEAWEALHEYDKASYYRQKWMMGMQLSKVADGKRKYSAMGYRARSVFQA